MSSHEHPYRHPLCHPHEHPHRHPVCHPHEQVKQDAEFTEYLRAKRNVRKGECLYCRVAKSRVKLYDQEKMYDNHSDVVALIRLYGRLSEKQQAFITPKSIRRLALIFHIRHNPKDANVAINMEYVEIEDSYLAQVRFLKHVAKGDKLFADLSGSQYDSCSSGSDDDVPV